MIDMNVWNFKKVIKKASINYLIPSISMEFDGKTIKSNSISPDNNAIAILNMDNDVLDGKEESFEFNFSDISSNLKPYLDLIKDENVKANITENKLIIKDSAKKKFDIFFCSKDFTNNFSGTDKSASFDYFYDSMISKDFFDKVNDIKKVALRFGKIYFICKDGSLYMETTDKTNPFCNNVQVKIDDIEDKELDISMCFDFKNLSYIISTIENVDDFRLKCTYLKDSEAGMILFASESGAEKYFITSKNE